MPELESWLAESAARLRKPGRPLVTLTYAQSLDGSISLSRSGGLLALSGPESKRMTHWLRTRHDAILVGIGTILADDPLLTVRYVEGASPRPVILDSHLRMPLSARVMDHPKRPILACLDGATRSSNAEALQQAGGELLPLGVDEQGCLSLPGLLSALAAHDIDSMMVEGGATVITSFLRQHLVDRFVLTISPVFVGGLHALIEGFANPPHLMNTGMSRFGEDLVLWGEL
jgi:GTP cyclohydrolase II